MRVEAKLRRNLKLQGIETRIAGMNVQELNHLAEILAGIVVESFRGRLKQ